MILIFQYGQFLCLEQIIFIIESKSGVRLFPLYINDWHWIILADLIYVIEVYILKMCFSTTTTCNSTSYIIIHKIILIVSFVFKGHILRVVFKHYSTLENVADHEWKTSSVLKNELRPQECFLFVYNTKNIALCFHLLVMIKCCTCLYYYRVVISSFNVWQ